MQILSSGCQRMSNYSLRPAITKSFTIFQGREIGCESVPAEFPHEDVMIPPEGLGCVQVPGAVNKQGLGHKFCRG